VTYDPTLSAKNFVCNELISNRNITTSAKLFPDIPELRYLTVCLGCALDGSGNPYRYSKINVLDFNIEKLPIPLQLPTLSCDNNAVNMACGTPSSEIYYRIGYSGDFTKYTQPVPILEDVAIQAYSKIGICTSELVSQKFSYEGEALANPVIQCNNNHVIITCTTYGSLILYRTGGTGQYQAYQGQFSISEDTLVEAYSTYNGQTSTIVSQVCEYSEEHDYSEDYLTFRVLEPGTIKWASVGDISRSIEYSINNGSWTSIASTSEGTTISVLEDNIVRFRGNNTEYAQDRDVYCTFGGGTATFNIEGNIMSLLHGDDFASNSSFGNHQYVFKSLFDTANVVSASNLILPAMVLTKHCYRAMFSKCSTLVEAPRLPATTVEEYCYYYMFENCTALTDAPELPATTLAPYCYGGMFYGCTSLTIAPELPATTMRRECYMNMFSGCTSLTTAPELPATTFAMKCYDSMFKNCTSLTNAPNLPNVVMNFSCCRGMFAGCTSLVVAPKLPGTLDSDASQCYFGMFDGCTSLTTAPDLPSTIVAGECYSIMFRNCTSLKSPPKIAATTLVSKCCQNMFRGCSKINNIAVEFSDWNDNASTLEWLWGVASNGIFTCPTSLPDTRGTSNIPTNWTIRNVVGPLTFTSQQAGSTVRLDKVGSPNAISLQYSTDGSNWVDYTWSGDTSVEITLTNVNDKVYFKAGTENSTIARNGDNYYQFVMSGRISAGGNIQYLLKADGSRTDAPAYCYYNLFRDCTVLTSSPELPATTLGLACYSKMFKGCSSLYVVSNLPATSLASNCYHQMFDGCTSLVDAPELPATTLDISCYYDMFNGCTSLISAP
jgi:hypothetical protein